MVVGRYLFMVVGELVCPEVRGSAGLSGSENKRKKYGTMVA